MHLRRALLLFAIVLGLAAIAASVSRPVEEEPERSGRPPAASERAPSVSPGTARAPAEDEELTLDAEEAGRVRLTTGQAATLLVEAGEPGQVEIPELGLGGFAQPLTPARFELLPSEPGRYEVIFTPAASDAPRQAGTLLVRLAD